jgi:hypothetical protein
VRCPRAQDPLLGPALGRPWLYNAGRRPAGADAPVAVRRWGPTSGDDALTPPGDGHVAGRPLEPLDGTTPPWWSRTPAMATRRIAHVWTRRDVVRVRVPP